MGGGGGGSTSQTSTTILPPEQQKNVDLLLAGARDIYSGGGPQYYQGQTYADTTNQQLQGREAAGNFATGAGQALVDSTINSDRYFLDNNNLFNFQNNPGYAGVRNGIIQDTTRNLTENILPQIRSGSVASGALGGSRQGLSEALAIGRTNDALSTNLANLDSNMYAQNLGQRNAAAARAPQNYNLGLAPADTLQAVGSQYQSDQQKAIDDSMNRFNFEQMRPLLNLQNLQGFTGSAGQYGGTTISTGEQKSGGGGTPWVQIGGTLLTVAAIY